MQRTLISLGITLAVFFVIFTEFGDKKVQKTVETSATKSLLFPHLLFVCCSYFAVCVAILAIRRSWEKWCTLFMIVFISLSIPAGIVGYCMGPSLFFKRPYGYVDMRILEEMVEVASIKGMWLGIAVAGAAAIVFSLLRALSDLTSAQASKPRGPTTNIGLHGQIALGLLNAPENDKPERDRIKDPG